MPFIFPNFPKRKSGAARPFGLKSAIFSYTAIIPEIKRKSMHNRDAVKKGDQLPRPDLFESG